MKPLSNITQNVELFAKIVAAIWLLFNINRVFAFIREVFGRIDKPELLAMIFTPVMIWMIWSERVRDHEWAIYDDFKFATIAIIVMYGFGLKPIIKSILLIRGVNTQDIKEALPGDSDSADRGDSGSSDPSVRPNKEGQED